VDKKAITIGKRIQVRNTAPMYRGERGEVVKLEKSKLLTAATSKRKSSDPAFTYGRVDVYILFDGERTAVDFDLGAWARHLEPLKKVKLLSSSHCALTLGAMQSALKEHGFKRVSERGRTAPVPYPEGGHVYQRGDHQIGIYADMEWDHCWDDSGMVGTVSTGVGARSLERDLLKLDGKGVNNGKKVRASTNNQVAARDAAKLPRARKK
jgi:hypothetical protein